jgi:hypothetical protein
VRPLGVVAPFDVRLLNVHEEGCGLPEPFVSDH